MYFVVSIKVMIEDAKGKVKKHTERYLVDAMSVTEAEARAVKYMEDQGVNEFEVSAASQSKIVAVINDGNQSDTKA